MRSVPYSRHDGSPLIFVIDDHDDTRELMRQWFEMNGFDVAAFPDGRQAVEDVLRWRPDVIVMDGRLPDQDGWTITRQVRSGCGPQSKTPIVLVSAATDAEAQAAAVTSGCDCYMVKPVDLDRLSAVVAKLLTHSEAPPQLLGDS